MDLATDFRSKLPRVYELKDRLTDPAHPDAYFRDFGAGLITNPSKLKAFLNLESQLGKLDTAGWVDLRDRAVPRLIAPERSDGRGWQGLFDLFSKARAYEYLQEIGASDIHFLPCSKRRGAKTPDLAASWEGSPLFCEVKTLNISQEAADQQRRVAEGEMVSSSTGSLLGAKYLVKLTNTLEHAVEQLDGADPTRTAKRIVFATLHFDDWVGDYQREYISQIDAHLAQNPVTGAELVFCLGSNLFKRSFTMRTAIVLDA
jgi:hypothetical protein